MNLDTEKCTVCCLLCTVLKYWELYVFRPALVPLNAPYCYITPQLVLSKDVPHLHAVTL